MAVFYDTYEITIKIDNQKVDLSSGGISFSIKDSIHSLYPILVMEVKDLTGIWQEYLLTSERIPITISYGLKDDFITCPFVLVNEELPEMTSNTFIAGNSIIRGYHAFYDIQEIKSKAYKKRISDIITEISNTYSFANTGTINDTSNDNYWYQPLITDADFMTKILLPNAFSYNSSNSPFFLFINSNDSFNLRNYDSMINQQPVKTLNYVQEKFREPSLDFIRNLKKFKTGSEITKYSRNRLIFNYSKEDGSLVEDKDGITSYPDSTNRNLPLFSDDLKSSYLNLDEEKESTGKQENLRGRKLTSMKDSLFLERFLITTYLDISLRAGQMIGIEVPIYNDGNNKKNSLYFSGNLLIEECDHVWDSSNDRKGEGYTQLLCSRKFLPNLNNNTYKLKEKLMKT